MKGRIKKPIILKRPYLGPPAKESRRKDVFHQLGIDPLRESFNPALLSYFVTEMGRVASRAETQLTWKSQRRLSKAIRRAKMMGIIPLHSRKARL
jgi:small subunit ribosomal protein S18